TRAPAGSKNDTSKWKIPTVFCELGEPFPCSDPESPATLPVVFQGRDHAGRACSVAIDHWADEAKRRDSVKFWAGAAGYPGAALALDAVSSFRDCVNDVVDDPFSFAAAQSSSFRFDWRRDYIPLDLGFSLNEHPTIGARGFPVVELMAAIGLGHSRPQKLDRLEYRYGVVAHHEVPAGEPGFLPTPLHRAGLGGRPFGLPYRAFRIRLGWPSKEGQARAITDVVELPNNQMNTEKRHASIRH
ncbi:MAG: type I-U CRISPR-associated protein Cas8c, partial [Myxococcota bacterium]